MYNSNIHRQTLREKVLKWLSNVPNATLAPAVPFNGPNVVQQKKASIEKPEFRATGGKSFSTQSIHSGILLRDSTTNSEHFRYPNKIENNFR